MPSSGPTAAPALPGWLVSLWLTLPWLQPWAPGPETNTVPLLVSWGCLAVLLAAGRWPDALELARAWTWAALLSSLMGLLQYFGEAALLGGWVHVPAYLGDAVGNLRQRNQLATLTSIGAVAVLWWHTQGLRTRLACLALAMMAIGNAATGSRTGLLQWLLLPTLLALWHRSSRPRGAPWSWPLLLWALAAYTLASMLLPHALSAWRGADVSHALARMGDTGGCGSRRVLWANVLHLIGEKPWTGWGWNELKYAHYMARYPDERFCDILGNAHNLPLHLAFSFGVPAAVAISLVALGLMVRARPWRLARTSSSLGWGVLLVIGLHSLLEYPLWYGPFQLSLLSAIVLVWPAAQGGLARLRRPLACVGLGGLCLIVAIAGDYARMRQIYLPAAQRLSLWRDDPWGAARQSWFFGQAVRFAEVTSTPVTTDNAQAMVLASQAALHYSPEPKVIGKLVQSARLTGNEALAQWHETQQQTVYGAKAD